MSRKNRLAAMGFSNRGAIMPGYFADLVLFDAAVGSDRADFGKALEQAVGVRTVWVNGQVVFQDGKTTGVYSGRPLRRENAPGPAAARDARRRPRAPAIAFAR